MFEPHPWIKRWACSRSWAVAPVLQYFRALRGDFANIIINQCLSFILSGGGSAFWPQNFFFFLIGQLFFFLVGASFGYLVDGKKFVSARVSSKPPSTNFSMTDSKALSTSFEKTCMRQIHCLDRLFAMVNKGPYHAQGLFSTTILLFLSFGSHVVPKKGPKTAHFRSVKCIFGEKNTTDPRKQNGVSAAFRGQICPHAGHRVLWKLRCALSKVQKRLISGR